MEFWEIILYSAIQGITEFLPVSSSAHLVIIENLLNWPTSGRTMAIAAHLGTLIAVIIFLRKDIHKIYTSIHNIKIYQIDKNILLIRNIILITLPIYIVGLIIFKNLDKYLLTLSIIGYGFLFSCYFSFLWHSSKYELICNDVISCLLFVYVYVQ